MAEILPIFMNMINCQRFCDPVFSQKCADRFCNKNYRPAEKGTTQSQG